MTLPLPVPEPIPQKAHPFQVPAARLERILELLRFGYVAVFVSALPAGWLDRASGRYQE